MFDLRRIVRHNLQLAGCTHSDLLLEVYQSIGRAVCSLHMVSVHINDLLDLVITSHEDSGPIMNMLGDYLEHALHLTVHGLSTG